MTSANVRYILTFVTRLPLAPHGDLGDINRLPSRDRTPAFFLLDSRTSKPKSLLVRTHFY